VASAVAAAAAAATDFIDPITDDLIAHIQP
jgi:hypothetical protein